MRRNAWTHNVVGVCLYGWCVVGAHHDRGNCSHQECSKGCASNQRSEAEQKVCGVGGDALMQHSEQGCCWGGRDCSYCALLFSINMLMWPS